MNSGQWKRGEVVDNFFLFSMCERYNKSNMKRVAIFSAFLSLALFGAAWAQSPTGPTQLQQQRNASMWNIALTPRTPGPNESVAAKIVSYSINVNTAAITWYLNGGVVLSGVGETEFSFFTGPAGTKTILRAVLETAGSNITERTVEVAPASVDILWTADTYTPPFYKGKALPTYGSTVRVTAIPNLQDVGGTRIPVQDIMFTWKKSRFTMPEKSGAGKKTLVYAAGFPKSDDIIGVVASTRDGKSSAEARVDVSVIDPKIVIYENLPLEGVRYESALGNSFQMSRNEVALSLSPYFFSFPLRGINTGRYEWFLDGRRIEPSEKRNEFTFGKPGTGSGRANIRIDVSSPISQEILQRTEKSIALLF